jgi:hypothetical protein
MNLSSKIIIIMSIIIVVLILILIFRQPVIIPKPTDNSRLKREIIDLKIQNDSLSLTIDNISLQRDTIILYKDSIRNIYHETIKYINISSASQLDSIIRANWD